MLEIMYCFITSYQKKNSNVFVKCHKTLHLSKHKTNKTPFSWKNLTFCLIQFMVACHIACFTCASQQAILCHENMQNMVLFYSNFT